jgi:5-methylcytosine-specific restriction endonuclease McrA
MQGPLWGPESQHCCNFCYDGCIAATSATTGAANHNLLLRNAVHGTFAHKKSKPSCFLSVSSMVRDANQRRKPFFRVHRTRTLVAARAVPWKRGLTSHMKRLIACSQDWQCAACTGLLPASYQIDHVQPLFLGGHPTLPSNLRALCDTCHGLKNVYEGTLLKSIRGKRADKLANTAEEYKAMYYQLMANRLAMITRLRKELGIPKEMHGRLTQWEAPWMAAESLGDDGGGETKNNGGGGETKNNGGGGAEVLGDDGDCAPGTFDCVPVTFDCDWLK